MKEEITNELKILEFQVDNEQADGKISNGFYGINVLKVQRIINMPEDVVQIPESHPAILGIITIQDVSIPVIDLTKSLQRSVPDLSPAKVIITEFCGQLHGFAVHTVNRIHNLNWKDVEHPPDLVDDNKVYSTGIIRLEGKVALLLDFEKIVSDINPEMGVKEEIIEDEKPDRSTKFILVSEDSSFIRTSLKHTLVRAGYNVHLTADGREAIDKLEEFVIESKTSERPLGDFVNLMIADLEMPQVDGRELVRMVKANPELQHLPIVIFSSLINEDYDKKAVEMDVNAVIGKPDIIKLVGIIDKILL